MTASITNEALLLEIQESGSFAENIISTAKKVTKEAGKLELEYEKILNLTTMSMKMFANSYYKETAFLEASDIEQIKTSLSNFNNKNEKVNEFKNFILEELTDFQSHIKTKHNQKIAQITKEKLFLERQLSVITFAKNKLVRERLARVEWPYDKKTKEYDSKISALQIKIQKWEQRIEEEQKKRPYVSEKDILMYQMYLKEKYAK